MTVLPGHGSLDAMTSLASRPDLDPGAADAEVVVRPLTEPVELVTAAELFVTIWRPGSKQPQVSAELMRALAHAGSYVAGAFDGPADGAPMVGACVAFFGSPASRSLHSHIAGVLPGAQGRSVGHALKVHQRAWAAERGLVEVSWTFDPLLRRNAWFNIAKLGALPTAYLTDFYGDMTDGINTGRGSDRLHVAWPVPALPAARRDVVPPGAQVALSVGVGDRPLAHACDGRAPMLVGLPEAAGSLDLATARAWRVAVRDVLGGLMADGGRVTGFTRQGQYVVEPAAASSGAAS